MRQLIMFSSLILVVACGGGETPKPAEKPAETKAPAAKVEPPPAAPAAPAAPATPAAPAAAGGEDLKALPPDQQKAKLMELGKKVYETGGSGGLACITCHQANGEGLPPSFPPLKGTKDFMGDCTKHAGYVVKGLNGEITVNGVKYNGQMPAQGNLTDLEIAAVITYERNTWGNDYGICLPETVAAARK
jgi:mono/diheme cytochrome c family protein